MPCLLQKLRPHLQSYNFLFGSKSTFFSGVKIRNSRFSSPAMNGFLSLYQHDHSGPAVSAGLWPPLHTSALPAPVKACSHGASLGAAGHGGAAGYEGAGMRHLDMKGAEKRRGGTEKGKPCIKWTAQELSLLRAALTKERPDGKPGSSRPP